jgi:WD40 repeat protein
MICFTPLRQFAPKQTKAAVASIHVLTDNVLVMFSDSSIGYYKFSASKKTSKRPFIFHADKHRFMASHELKFSHNTIKKATNRQHFEDSTISRLPIKSSSFAVTLGGIGIETVKKKIQNAGRLNTYIEPLKEAEATGYIISCGYWDDTVKVHSMDGAKVLCSEAGGHRGAIRCLSMCSDSPLLITGGQDATCRVWVVDHIDLAVALGDGYTQTAQVGSNAGTGLLKLCHVLWGHRHPIACLDMSSELDIAVSGDLGGLICVHTIRRGEFIRSILPIPNEASYSVQEIALSHTGTFVAYLDNQSLHCITVNNAHLCSTYVDDEINAMKLTSDGEILVTGGKKGHVVIRSAHDLLELSSLDLSKHGPIRCVSFTPDILNPIPQFLFVGSEDGLVTLVTENKDASLEEEIVTFV